MIFHNPVPSGLPTIFPFPEVFGDLISCYPPCPQGTASSSWTRKPTQAPATVSPSQPAGKEEAAGSSREQPALPSESLPTNSFFFFFSTWPYLAAKTAGKLVVIEGQLKVEDKTFTFQGIKHVWLALCQLGAEGGGRLFTREGVLAHNTDARAHTHHACARARSAWEDAGLGSNPAVTQSCESPRSRLSHHPTASGEHEALRVVRARVDCRRGRGMRPS